MHRYMEFLFDLVEREDTKRGGGFPVDPGRRGVVIRGQGPAGL